MSKNFTGNIYGKSKRVTVHSVYSNTLRDAQKSCFA